MNPGMDPYRNRRAEAQIAHPRKSVMGREEIQAHAVVMRERSTSLRKRASLLRYWQQKREQA